MDRISDLPQEILQRILYFLPQVDVVQTSVLSKSWRYNWCTRPNLDFSDFEFLRKFQRNERRDIVDKTLLRYYDRKMPLEEFHISISEDYYEESVSLLEHWIPLLKNMSLKMFRAINGGSGYSRLPLPPVVFSAESLQNLHLEGFMLDQIAIERIAHFKHLKSLCLKYVYIEYEILQKITASCPLIETLNFDRGLDRDRGRCHKPATIKLNELHDLKHLSFSDGGRTAMDEPCCITEIHPPSLETIYIHLCDIWFPKGAEFRNLRNLSLHGVDTTFKFFSSCKFPSLKRLTLSGCSGLKESQLFIDAPNILYFKYDWEYFVPSISFATTSREWRSNINICLGDDASSSWILKLKELLKSLSQSKISLTIGQCDPMQENTVVQDNDYDKPVVVECLNLYCGEYFCSFSFSSILNGMFGICRPRNIIGVGDSFCKGLKDLVAFLWQILMERGNEDQEDDQLRQLLFRDLEEVSFQMKERNREEWHPATLSEFILKCKQSESRFTLKWRETFNTASSSSTRQTMSGLRYRKEKCKHQNCGKETTIMISETGLSSGRLFYCCSDHGYSHWCDPLEVGQMFF